MATLSAEELRKLSRDLIERPESGENLTPEVAAQVKKFVSPYGSIVAANESWINISVINWRDEFMKKFHMMGLVGYLYRTLEEYEDTEDLDAVRAKWNKKIKEQEEFNRQLLSQGAPQETVEQIIPDMRQKMETETKLRRKVTRDVARRFLNKNFNYNPDRHLRGTHSENSKDPERKPKAEVLRENMAIAESAPHVERKISENPELTFAYLKDKLLYTYQAANQCVDTIRGVMGSMRNPDSDIDDKMIILSKKHNQLKKLTGDMSKLVGPLAAADTLAAITVEPPIDVFHHYNRYITNHYEQLLEAFEHLHNEKPDLHFSVIYYDHFKSDTKARDHRIMNTDLFRADVMSISNNGISMIGPFKENRQRVDFYNKNTEIMKRMMEQMEVDHRLGKDLMEKQMVDKKKKNIREVGPDAPGLAAYTKTGTGANSTVQELGAKKALTKEEQDAIFAEQRRAEQDAVPEDAIQVEMFYPETTQDGESELKRTYFYTQAEAPLHMQEGSVYMDRYQPKREPGQTLNSTLSTKVVTDRHGRKMEVKDLSEISKATKKSE